MTPVVSVIMGSTSDLPIMEKAAKVLNDFKVPFEMNALSAHRTPEAVEEFAKNAQKRGIKVIIAAAGMAAHLGGVIASMTTVPVIGVPIKSSIEGLDSLLFKFSLSLMSASALSSLNSRRISKRRLRRLTLSLAR